MPLAFCRECGQDYFPVRRHETDEGELLEPREISDRPTTDGQRNGYLYVSDDNPWPTDEAEQLALLPNDWLEGRRRARRSVRTGRASRSTSRSRQTATSTAAALSAVFIPAPFRFCLGAASRTAAARRPTTGNSPRWVRAGVARARRSWSVGGPRAPL